MVIMSSAALTAEAVVEAMAKEGKKVGVINIRLWRPFDMEYFISKLPKTVKNIVAMDRARDFTSNGELLYKEVLAALFKSGRIHDIKQLKNCTYGICGHDITPGEVLACFKSFEKPELMQFRIGVNDPEALPAEKCEL